ncbi:hypothetical protein NDU88_001163 [Pleurodeles waltl]|uniref:Uncharacterized protein n=1 Tax=Pleurodeles waltl TaxID=8319 RepID=A0AAV7LBT3_PLEWA|nr:hypothetical protein NDU88_001163 [Pleurodeles waltl]
MSGEPRGDRGNLLDHWHMDILDLVGPDRRVPTELGALARSPDGAGAAARRRTGPALRPAERGRPQGLWQAAGGPDHKELERRAPRRRAPVTISTAAGLPPVWGRRDVARDWACVLPGLSAAPWVSGGLQAAWTMKNVRHGHPGGRRPKVEDGGGVVSGLRHRHIRLWGGPCGCQTAGETVWPTLRVCPLPGVPPGYQWR